MDRGGGTKNENSVSSFRVRLFVEDKQDLEWSDNRHISRETDCIRIVYLSSYDASSEALELDTIFAKICSSPCTLNPSAGHSPHLNMKTIWYLNLEMTFFLCLYLIFSWQFIIGLEIMEDKVVPWTAKLENESEGPTPIHEAIIIHFSPPAAYLSMRRGQRARQFPINRVALWNTIYNDMRVIGEVWKI